MNITGITKSNKILFNEPFILSGSSQSNLSTINVVDSNGVDVSECFGISTKIVKLSESNINLSGDCDSSLEVIVTSGVKKDVECLYTGYTQQQNGLLLFNYADGRITDNIHPECCTSLGHTPEIGAGNYYVCRVIPVIDVTDCNNYTPKNVVDGNGYEIFEFVTGGTITSVPSVECCTSYGFVESVVNNEIKCIKYVEPDPCNGLVVFKEPSYGNIVFINEETGVETTDVDSIECCINLGYNYEINGDKYTCYKSIAPKPTISFNNDSCCTNKEPIVIGDLEEGCNNWCLLYDEFSMYFEPFTFIIDYVDCSDKNKSITIYAIYSEVVGRMSYSNNSVNAIKSIKAKKIRGVSKESTGQYFEFSDSQSTLDIGPVTISKGCNEIRFSE